MALVVCPECRREVSDKAVTCIHCGYPMQKSIPITTVQPEIMYTPSKDRVEGLVSEADALRASGDYIRALALYEEAGELGNVHSQIWAGNFYDRAIGVPADYTKAVYWFRKAAERNDMTALNNLGMMYQRGRGVPQNTPRAIELCRRASALGNAVASGNLGTWYENGTGVDKNPALAVQYYSLAIQQGCTDKVIMNNLAVCYMEAKGTERNYAKAEELLQRAIALGNEKARENLAVLRTRTTKPLTATTPNPPPSKARKTCIVIIIILALLGCFVLLMRNDESGCRVFVTVLFGIIGIPSLIVAVISMYAYFVHHARSVIAPLSAAIGGGCTLIIGLLSEGFESEENMILGGLVMTIFGVVWYLVYRSNQRNGIYKKEKEMEQLQIEKERQQVFESQNQSTPWATRYMMSACPYCGHYKVRKAKWEDKQASVLFWGGASSKIGTNYKCEHCGQMWE